jgi:hypothetical protein
MKIISINNKDIIFLSLFLSFGEIQPCLFEYLKRKQIDLSLYIPTQYKKSNGIKVNGINTNDINKLYYVSDRLREEFIDLKENHNMKNDKYFNKPVPYIIFNIPKTIPKNKILVKRFNEIYCFILDYLYNYISSEYISILNDISRKNEDANSFITTLNNNIDNTDVFYTDHNSYIIIDSNVSRDLIIRFGFINLLNGKTNVIPYDELYRYFNTYDLKWLKYIKGSYKKLLVIYLSYFSYFMNNKLMISMLGQNIELLKLIKLFLFIFSNSNCNVKFISHQLIMDNKANTFYDSQIIRRCYLRIKKCKMLNFSDVMFNNLFDCRNLFSHIKKDILSINHMFYYNALLNTFYHQDE